MGQGRLGGSGGLEENGLGPTRWATSSGKGHLNTFLPSSSSKWTGSNQWGCDPLGAKIVFAPVCSFARWTVSADPRAGRCERIPEHPQHLLPVCSASAGRPKCRLFPHFPGVVCVLCSLKNAGPKPPFAPRPVSWDEMASSAPPEGWVKL